MAITLAETIKDITEQHLIQGGILGAQNANGGNYLLGTIPKDSKNVIDLPTSDSSNGGVMCGFALAGKRPIYVIRFQGFLWYNAVSLVNYAAKSKEMWNVPCPIFIRATTMEGHIGPVAGGSHHGLICKMPGIPLFVPCSSDEYKATWKFFMQNDIPVFCSEHRKFYSKDAPRSINHHSDITYILIGGARDINHSGNAIHLWQIKPLIFTDEEQLILKQSKEIIIIDREHIDCGIGEYVAYNLRHLNATISVQGLKDKTAGFYNE